MDERGAIAVPFLISATLLLLILALVIDFGILWNYSAELERAVDAAALAGASEVYVSMYVDGLGGVYSQTVFLDETKARETAQSVLDKNLSKFIQEGLTVQSVSISVNGFKVEVAATINASHHFSVLTGFRDTQISKKAVAEYVGP